MKMYLNCTEGTIEISTGTHHFYPGQPLWNVLCITMDDRTVERGTDSCFSEKTDYRRQKLLSDGEAAMATITFVGVITNSKTKFHSTIVR